MTTPAELARANAITFEAKKDALQQRQSGDWKVSFTVQGSDMDERLTRAPMGARFVAVLVQIDDAEMPITQTTKENKKDLNSEASTAAAPSLTACRASGKASARQWRDIQPAQQAGIRCSDPIFVTYLKERYPEDWRALEGDAAELVRYLCGVNSRAKIGIIPSARQIWSEIDDAFIAWKVIENA